MIFLSKGILPLEQNKIFFKAILLPDLCNPFHSSSCCELLSKIATFGLDVMGRGPLVSAYNGSVQCSVVQCRAGQCITVQCSAVQYSVVKCSVKQCSAVLQQEYCTTCIRPVIDLMGGRDKKQQTVFKTYWGTLDLLQRLCFASYSFSIQKIILIEICICICI